MRSPACLIFAVVGLFSIVPVSEAARGGGAAPRPAVRVSRVASAPRPAPPTRSVNPVQSRSSSRAPRSDVRHDRRELRDRNHPISVAPGYPYGYYGYNPAYALPYTPGDYAVPGSDETPYVTSPASGESVTPACVNSGNEQSRDDLDQEQSRLQADLQASPGWAAVNADISTSRAAIAEARQNVDRSLAASPEYQVAKAQKAAAEDLLATLRSSDRPDEPQVWSAAENKLQASETMNRLEQQALAADSSFAEASSKLQSAAAARNGMLESLRARMQNEAQ